MYLFMFLINGTHLMCSEDFGRVELRCFIYTRACRMAANTHLGCWGESMETMARPLSLPLIDRAQKWQRAVGVAHQL